MFWNFSSAPALRRRSSVLALSSMDISESGNESRTKSARDFNRNHPSVRTLADPSWTSQQLVRSSPPSLPTTLPPSSAASSELLSKREKQFRRTYDGVYRTHEPLPGKPLIEFEDKVWDLEEEFYSANEKINF